MVTPDREQSGIGTAVTIHHPLRASRVRHTPSAVEAYAVQGTPADCVILALEAFFKDQIDLVVAGINEGANLGNDVLISGTVSAALQAHFHDLPAIAVSVAALRDPKFDVAAALTQRLVGHVAAGNLPRDVLLNVNVPNLPVEKIKGVMGTSLAHSRYAGAVEMKTDSRGKAYYWLLRGQPKWELKEGTDIWALRNGFISVTPLHIDLVNGSKYEGMGELYASLSSAFTGQVARPQESAAG